VAGYLLGEQWHRIESVAGWASNAVVAAIVVHRLPWRPMLALALYPGVFGAIYAFAAAAGVLTAALIILKAVTAALVAVLLMFTTPYPQVFAPVQRILPAVVGDALLMTYRSLFLLLEKFGHTLTAVRLRAGVFGANPIRSASSITRSLGGVLLYSIDLSQRTHDVMYLRGYDGRLAVTPQPSVSAGLDRTVVAAGVAICSVAVAWRLWWPALNPYAWLPPLAGMLLLALALIWRAVRKDPA
jgi:energy-coupling factor transporter transmembrane protein EcfT